MSQSYEELNKFIDADVKLFIRNYDDAVFEKEEIQRRINELKGITRNKKEEKEMLRQVLADRIGAPDLQVEEVVDEKLVAGVAVQVGTLVLNGSFANAIVEATSLVKEKLSN